MIERKMVGVYQHRESLLSVNVYKVEDWVVMRSMMGIESRCLVSVKMETETGQPVIFHSDDMHIGEVITETGISFLVSK